MIKIENIKDLSSYKGQKTIAMFSTEWCGECIMNKPIVQKLSQEFTDINFVTIDVDDNELWINDGNDEYSITEAPTWIGYSNNEIMFRETNFQNESKLRELISKL